jgi:hypothetical protein
LGPVGGGGDGLLSRGQDDQCGEQESDSESRLSAWEV